MTALPARSPVLIAEAVLLIVLGIVAVLVPLIAGAVVGAIIGLLLLISGIVGLVSAFSGHAHVHRGWSIASAIIALIVGVIILLNPLAGAAVLTVLLAIYLVFDGATLIGLALDQRQRGVSRWGLLMASGIVDIVLAVLLFALGGFGSAIVVGLILGFDLLFAGVSLLMVHRTPILEGRTVPTL